MRIEEILSELNIQYVEHGDHHHTRPGWINLDCPWCSKGLSRYRLGINTSGGYCNCWACGPHGLTEVLLELSDSSYGRIKDLTKDLTLERLPDEVPRGKEVVYPRGLDVMKRPHRRYLEHVRGLDPSELERLWGLRGIGIAAKMSWRIFIPVHLRGQVVSWTTRTIGERGLRYRSAEPHEETVNHRTLLFGEDYCRHAVIVHEGPFDVFRTGPGSVCTFGTGFTRAQVLRLSRYPVRAVCFDNEDEAQRRARKLVAELTPFPGSTYLVRLETGKDSGSAKEKEVTELRKRFLE